MNGDHISFGGFSNGKRHELPPYDLGKNLATPTRMHVLMVYGVRYAVLNAVL